jgi:hypothetical protein
MFTPPVPLTVTDVTGITWFEIVTTRLPTIPDPSFALANTVTVPLSTAVSTPEELILA